MAATDPSPNPRSQITFLDIVKFGVMIALAIGALKLTQDRSGLVQLAAFMSGFLVLPVLLWTIFTVLDRRKATRD